MRSLISLSLCLSLFLSFSTQAQFSDDFSDGDFSTNPTWVGDVSEFQINGANELQSNGPVATETIHLATASTQFENTVWEFWLKLDFSPSTSNFVQVYLMSDQADLEGDLNGYYIRIGESGSSDGIDLYKQEGNSSTKLIDGSTAILTASSDNQARIRVTRDQLGNWTLLADATGGTNFVSEGTVFDNSFTLTNFFGVLCRHTSTRNQLFFFDDFTVEDGGIALVSATAISDTEVDVQFSEAVAAVTAEEATNYNLNNGLGTPSNAQIDNTDGSLIHLTYVNIPTGNYQLTVNNVSSLASNEVISPNSIANFNFTAPIAFNSIIINEIFADPSPVIGLPPSEFIELHNTTTTSINLSGITFSDGSSTATISNVNLAGNAYLILCTTANATNYQAFGDVIGLSSFPTLNNGGETLTLRDPSGNIIDEVSYETSWYNDAIKDDGGFSLELINPNDTCSLAEDNWSAAIDASGGTPGQVNSIFDTTTSQGTPAITTVQVEATDSLIVQFDSRMDVNTLLAATYTLSDGNTNFTVQNIQILPNGNSIALTVTPLNIGAVYSLQIENALACNQEALAATPFEFALGAPPSFHDLIITEIMADPNPIVGLPDAEYIEIYNTSDIFLSLNTVTLSDLTGTFSLPNEVIAPKSYLILTSAADQSAFSQQNILGLASFPSLTNDGEPLVLTSTGGELIFEIEYSSDWFEDPTKTGGGFSLEMKDINVPCLEEINWKGSDDLSGGTPGEENAVAAIISDNTAPILLRAVPLTNTEILLEFNEKLDSASTQMVTISIDNGIDITAQQFVISATKEIRLQLAQTLAVSTSYTISVNGLQDCAGNLMTTANTFTIQLPETAVAGDLLLNEVVPDAFSGGSRYVELYNNSDKFISLKDWQLGVENALGTVGTSSGQRAILFNEEWLLGPGEYVVFTDEKIDIVNDYPSGQHDRVFEVTSSGFVTLDVNDEDKQKLLLIDPTGTEIDRMTLQEEMYFDLLDDVNGVALERVSFTAPTNDLNNWASAAENVGFGTPGYLNSQHIANPKSNLGTDCFELSPDVFSPDNDGFDDILTIHYTCNQNNLVANITIYDANGREIKRLTQNQLLSTTGFITWDGVSDSGQKARVGYYILYIETFGLNGDVTRLKKTVAVGAKF